MTYDDEAYLRACVALRSAIYVLVENEIPRADIEEMVEETLDESVETEL